MKALFLGCGTSTGVPLIGCKCEVCSSDNPRNKRLRSSVLLRTATTTLLVDTSPDLRQQALRHALSAIDAVVYTHEHLDHTAGFDDLRAFCWRRKDRLPLYAGAACLAQLRRMYAWAFDESNTYQGYVRPDAHDHRGLPFCIGDVEVTPVRVEHASVETHGYVFRSGGVSFGYLPDVKSIPEQERPKLLGLDALAMDGLCFPGHRTHLSIDENIALMQELAPARGFVTHSGHNVEYSALAAYLPSFMQPAYDGLEVTITEHGGEVE